MTKEEFGQLVLESTDSLYRISKGILRNDTDCEDAVWEAVGIGFEKLHTLRQEQYAKTWLIRIVIHECYKVLRRRKRMADVEMDEVRQCASNGGSGAAFTVVSGNTGQGESYSELYEALFKLDEKYRMPLILYYLEGYSVREIARILQSTDGTVKSWLSRGRKTLKRIMEED